ncbi:MAG TPA: DUF3231 family protein [Bacillales bacterium]|nr:DUF3231 family protein [Bacillales bacterium]
MPKSLVNMLQSATKIMDSLADNRETPLHVGETMACWTYLAFVGSIVTYEEVALNTVTDPKLKELIQDAKGIANSHKKRLSEFMRKEGIPLPALPEDKPKSDPSSIPLGARLTDDEIVNTLAVNFVFAADTCAASASQSLRTDVGLMFLQFQMDKLSLGFKARELMKKKGWLKIPPYYHPPGSPMQNDSQSP